MKPNIGDVDRTIRMSLGYMLVIVAAVSKAHWTFGILGVLLMATATFKWCPLYLPLRISSVGESDV